MFKSLLLSLFSGVLLILIYLFYQANLSFTSDNYKLYAEAIKVITRWQEDQVDLTQKHFQPCRNCGFELAIAHDNSYCQRSDLFKLVHPVTVEQDMMVFRDYGGNDLARKIIGINMYDALPGLVQTKPIGFGYQHLPYGTSVIYTYAKNYFRTHTLGKQGGCLFQKYFHVPGQEELALKSNQSTHFHNYIDKLRSQNKTQQCIEEASYEKPTFRMWLKDDCQAFFDTINSQKYKETLDLKGIQYIFKTNRHLGNGILILDHENEMTIRNWYQNGNQCGKNASTSIIQEYLQNPYLFNGHKMEFRSYFQIASTNPPIIYGYRKALIKQCAYKFDLKDFTKETHVCNSAITKTMQNEDDLFIDWNLEELQDMLFEQGKIKNKRWLDEYLFPQILKKITHLYFSVEQYLFKDSRVGEFFGVDFIMDDNLRLWIFECNRNPNFLAATEGRKEKFGKLIPDMLEIQMQLVRSRYKRIRSFIYEQLLPKIQNKIQVYKLQDLQNEFLLLMKDRYEKEFQPSKDNLALIAYVGDLELAKQMGVKNVIQNECLLSQ